ncbi:C6 finger domain protein [Aspergillus bombycis]|uniref:C6 finger domain protein n=1 Tax=Aspergillus bombycis TaxID=109264 RepID=A0A1F7ZS05_9EURO|nr:C6 finger domain protein [Aspergillus bombycis]OGM42241.1 C6 finger domain protein [Aspergillus bombycis]
MSPSDIPHSGLRKGTKSCTECRRRKVRCIRIPREADTCQQCEDREVVCTAQVSKRTRSSQPSRLPSRRRIAQLESQVAQLTGVVNNIEHKLGYKPSQIPSGKDDQFSGPDDSEGESSGSDIPMTEKPSHLQSLFQNHWLSADPCQHEQQAQQRMDKLFAQLSIDVRPKLQNMIPLKEEVADIAGSAYDWLTALHALFPQPLMLKSPRELLDSYESMCSPHIDVILLASWLLTLALTAQQIHTGREDSNVYLRKCQRRFEFCQSIIHIVDDTLLCHDRLVGTIQGLGMALHFIRLQVGQGNFQKAWIKLRHIIAIAELMGLPKIFQAVRFNQHTGADDTSLHKVQLWQAICNIERLNGMVLNLPPGTARYQLTTASPLNVDGSIHVTTYLTRLLNISVKVYDLDEVSSTHESSMKTQMAALEMAQALGELASQAPDTWWVGEERDHITPDDVVQFLHCCVLMRVYLPVVLKQSLGDELMYARLPCIDACESVARRFLTLRRKLPAGLFMSRILDLQALTSASVLLLLSHHVRSTDRHSLRVDTRHLHAVVSEIITLLGERARDPTNSELAVEAYNTLRALDQLLHQDGRAGEAERLTVTVPLLGKIHVRRNARLAPQPRVTIQSSSQLEPNVTIPRWISASHPLQGRPSLGTNVAANEADSAPDKWRLTDLSWSVEGSLDNLLEDVFLNESIGQYVNI